MTGKPCINSWGSHAHAQRPAPNPGPRCATCWRAEKTRRAASAHERASQGVYGMAPGEYGAVWEAQGRRCALCRLATGRRKRLARDHDHETGQFRGILCGPCNKDVMGRAELTGDAVAYFVRCIEYLANPPSNRVKGL